MDKLALCNSLSNVSVGKIVGLHGLKGTAKVYSYAESLSVYKPGSSIIVTDKKGIKKDFTIRFAKQNNRTLLLSLEGITSRNYMEELVGSELSVKREKLPALNEGEYYWCDIIGLLVFNEKNIYMGRVESIISTGSNDVYVVKNSDDEELVPAIESVVKKIDLEKKKIIIEWP